MSIIVTSNKFDSNGFWTKPLTGTKILSIPESVSLFDQNGYHLTDIEQAYAKIHNYNFKSRREEYVIHKPWMLWDKNTGAHFNHCEIFQRKAFDGDAKKQLLQYAEDNHQLWKLIQMKPKWGIDVSIDYVDSSGNVFEVFHYEWDDFTFESVNKKKKEIENFILNKNWDLEAQKLWGRKEEWLKLPFFEQSEWKTNYYNLTPERFKNVIWEKIK